MLATIEIGTCVSVQGELVRLLSDGRISVKVGDREFTGRAANPELVKSKWTKLASYTYRSVA